MGFQSKPKEGGGTRKDGVSLKGRNKFERAWLVSPSNPKGASGANFPTGDPQNGLQFGLCCNRLLCGYWIFLKGSCNSSMGVSCLERASLFSGFTRENHPFGGSPKKGDTPIWLWVKNRYPVWNPCKWKSRLKPMVPWWSNSDPCPSTKGPNPSPRRPVAPSPWRPVAMGGPPFGASGPLQELRLAGGADLGAGASTAPRASFAFFCCWVGEGGGVGGWVIFLVKDGLLSFQRFLLHFRESTGG